MTNPGQTADDFAGIVAMATEQQNNQQAQMQQTPIQQHFNANSVTGVVPGPEGQVSSQGLPATQQFVQQAPIQQQQPVVPDPVEQPAQPVATVPVEAPAVVAPDFDLDSEVEKLLKEFGVVDQKPVEPPSPVVVEKDDDDADNQNISKELEKDNKISILLEKAVTERDLVKDQLSQERYEKEQYKFTVEKLQSKLSELVEQNTALQYDENKLEVSDQIKDFVHFYNKRSVEKDQQTPDSALTKRTLAEAIRVVEDITNMNLDTYINQYYLNNNPQFPKIGNNHYSPELLGLDPNQQRQKTFEEKKNDPNWNPMGDRF